MKVIDDGSSSGSRPVGTSVFEHTLVTTGRLKLMRVKRTIPKLHVQPSFWRWTLGFPVHAIKVHRSGGRAPINLNFALHGATVAEAQWITTIRIIVNIQCPPYLSHYIPF